MYRIVTSSVGGTEYTYIPELIAIIKEAEFVSYNYPISFQQSLKEKLHYEGPIRSRARIEDHITLYYRAKHCDQTINSDGVISGRPTRTGIIPNLTPTRNYLLDW